MRKSQSTLVNCLLSDDIAMSNTKNKSKLNLDMAHVADTKYGEGGIFGQQLSMQIPHRVTGDKHVVIAGTGSRTGPVHHGSRQVSKEQV